MQAVCDSDTLKTPRVMSPVTRNLGGTARKVPNTTHNKPQHTPNIKEIIYGKDRHTTPTGPLSRELDHTLQKYGSPPLRMYGNRDQHQTSETENISPPSPRQPVSRASVSSAARTRKTLNNLLSDNHAPLPSSRSTGSRRTSDPRETAGSFVGVSSSRKNNATVNNLTRKTAQPSFSSSRVPGASSKRSGMHSSLHVHDLHSPQQDIIPVLIEKLTFCPIFKPIGNIS